MPNASHAGLLGQLRPNRGEFLASGIPTKKLPDGELVRERAKELAFGHGTRTRIMGSVS